MTGPKTDRQRIQRILDKISLDAIKAVPDADPDSLREEVLRLFLERLTTEDCFNFRAKTQGPICPHGARLLLAFSVTEALANGRS